MRRCRLASARWAGRWRTRPRCWARWWAWTRATGGGHRGPADLPSARDILNSGDETTVLLSDFKVDIATYLAGRHDPRMRTLQDLIEFDDAHAAQEMPFFGQEVFLQSQAVDVNDPATIAAYRAAVANHRRLGGADGIDAALSRFGLDELVAPTDSVPWEIDVLDGDLFLGGSSTPTSLAGYPAPAAVHPPRHHHLSGRVSTACP